MSGKEIRLKSPLSANDVRSLNLGDIVYISGPAYEIKSVPQYVKILEIVEREKKLSFDLTNATIYHTFSSVKKVRDRWKLNYLGFFSSFVLNNQMPNFIRTFRIRAIIGKGGMNNKVLRAMREFDCVYLAGISGCAAYYTQGVGGITAVYFKGWGTDRIVMYNLMDLGPLLVTMDSHGNTIYGEVEKRKKVAMQGILKSLYGE